MQQKVMFIVIILVLSTIGFFMFRHVDAQVHHRVAEYAYTVAKGDYDALESIVEAPLAEAHISVLQMIDDGVFTIEDFSAGIKGLRSAYGVLKVNVAGETSELHLSLIREQGQWIIELETRVVVLTAAWLLDTTADSMTVFANNQQYVFSHEGRFDTIENIHYLAAFDEDIVFQEALSPSEPDRLLSIRREQLELEHYGYYPLEGVTAFFDAREEEIKSTSMSQLRVGMKGVQLHFWRDHLRGVVLNEGYIPDTIRVMLQTTGHVSSGHEEVVLNAGSGLRLEEKITGRTFAIPRQVMVKIIPQGEGVQVSWPGNVVDFSTRLTIFSNAERGIQIASIQRTLGTPTYRGHLELVQQDGRIYITNEVSLEAYLYSVVPSEMPISFGAKALEVQSIAARSYAVAEMLAGRYRFWGTHVVDSVMSQVYNNIAEQAISNTAVMATEGLVAVYEGEVVNAKFFSTSSGYTANSHEVWGEREFPSTPVPYLRAQPQILEDISIQNEDDWKAFFRSWDISSYDSNSPWFRWSIAMSREALYETITRNLPTRYTAQKEFVLTKSENGEFISLPIPEDPVGTLEVIRVVERGEGGNVTVLEIEGSKGTYRVLKEYNIRMVLRPIGYVSEPVYVERHDNSRVANYALLPSAFIDINLLRLTDGQLTDLIIFGGGNGHGVGLSQWGVRGMVERGFSTEEILQHYYPGSAVVSLHEQTW